MKKDIHPKYFEDATIKCDCGNTVTLGSTVQSMEVEICSNCHPFYTGTAKLVDTARRVDRFEARLKAAKDINDNKKQKTPRKSAEEKAEEKVKQNA